MVFGALGFLGKHVSRVLANSGCQLVITDLDKSKLDSFAKEIQKNIKIKPEVEFRQISIQNHVFSDFNVANVDFFDIFLKIKF